MCFCVLYFVFVFRALQYFCKYTCKVDMIANCAIISLHYVTLNDEMITVVQTKSDNDEILCLQLQSKTLTCTLQLS